MMSGNNPLAGMMGGNAGQPSPETLLQMFQKSLQQQGINVDIQVQGNKAIIIFSSDEVKKLLSKALNPQMMTMVSIERCGEMVLSIKLA